MTLRRFTTTLLSVSTFAVAGCATTNPPSELVKARQAYSDAEHSEAAQYDPAAVHEAKTALDQAEAMFSDEADSPKTRDAAYVAMRRAERAKVEGEIASLQARKAEAVTVGHQSQAKAAEKTQGELASTRAELAKATDARQASERANQALLNLQVTRVATVTEEPRGTVITLPSGDLFRSSEATLMPSAHAKLDLIATAVKEQGNRKILVEGHTDSRGKDADNMNLSRQRADSVANYLTQHGVASGNVSSLGTGATRPVGSNDTPEGRETNRRVEITIERAAAH